MVIVAVDGLLTLGLQLAVLFVKSRNCSGTSIRRSYSLT